MAAIDHRRLGDLSLWVVDCQTSGASPGEAQLIELCWARFRADGSVDPRALEPCGGPCSLVEGRRLPRRIAMLTGLDAETLTAAPPPRSRLESLVADISRATGEPLVLAHAASFERRWLRAEHPPADAWRWLCTLEIARRLLPGLPRRGLRALSGYLGHVLPSDRRQAPAHVRATCAVWSALVARLADEAEVHTLGELGHWLASTKAATRGGREFAMPRDLRLSLPSTPGIYRFLAGGQEVLYVGKARDLRRRVNSYFQKRRHGAERTLELLTQVKSVEVDAHATALEAALAENEAIKAHEPPYNIALRASSPREREVVYAAMDLLSRAERRDDAHPVGPLLGRRAIERLAALASRRAVAPGDLDLPPRLVDVAAFEAGLDAFYRAHGGVLGLGAGVPTIVDWLRLGARLWRKVEEASLLDKGDEQPPDEERKDEQPWSAEMVLEALELDVLTTARGLRRARMLGLLYDARLRWCSAAGGWRELHITGGELVSAEDGQGAGLDQRSPGRLRAGVAGPNIDLATYDRLRVLLTELRRLVGEGRALSLQLADGACLDGAGLARRLRWL